MNNNSEESKAIDATESAESTQLAPLRPIKYFAPLAFSLVVPNVYRSAYPIPRNYPFLEKIGFKTFVCLVPNEVNDELRDYCSRLQIKLLGFDVKLNQEPFVAMDVDELKKALAVIEGPFLYFLGICSLFYPIDPVNHPVMFFCLNGKVSDSRSLV